MQIPIRNIYYLLCYAWDRLEQADLLDVDRVDSTELVDLLANVLVSGTSRLLRRGLDRGYLPIAEDTACLRGRIDFAQSIKRNLLPNSRAHCIHDELQRNVLHNRILKSTLRSLEQVDTLDRKLRAQVHSLRTRLSGVDELHLTRSVFRRVQLHRNNAIYCLLMNVCELIHESVLVDERTGDTRFRDFIRDERRMRLLFQDFVFNFYRREAPQFAVKSDQLAWDAAPVAGDADLRMLPLMSTDISLRSSERTIVIDTKFYKETLQERFGKHSVRSAHLYQIFSYLKNLEPRGGSDARAEGILLYPTVGSHVDVAYAVGGHSLRVFTLDLAQEWCGIREGLLNLLAPLAPSTDLPGSAVADSWTAF